MIDAMAQRYGLLPTEVLDRASTFDMVVMDVVLTYQQYLQNKDKEGYVPEFTTEQLLEMRKAAL